MRRHPHTFSRLNAALLLSSIFMAAATWAVVRAAARATSLFGAFFIHQ